MGQAVFFCGAMGFRARFWDEFSGIKHEGNSQLNIFILYLKNLLCLQMKASDMKPLKWDDTLAQMAQAHVDRLIV